MPVEVVYCCVLNLFLNSISSYCDSRTILDKQNWILFIFKNFNRWRKAIYICKEARDSRYMMARLTIDGWWDFYGYFGTKKRLVWVRVPKWQRRNFIPFIHHAVSPIFIIRHSRFGAVDQLEENLKLNEQAQSGPGQLLSVKYVGLFWLGGGG